MQKVLRTDCDCAVSICDHAMQDVADMLQDTYDDGYDEGWNDAHETMRKFLISKGVDSVRDVSLPPPPDRTTKKPKAERKLATNTSELIN